MKYLKGYKLFEGSLEDVIKLMNDATQDMKDDGFEIETGETFDAYPKPYIVISRGKHFSLDKVRDQLNELVSQMDGSGYQMGSVDYSLSDNSTSKWYTLSFDPNYGEIKDDRIIDIVHPKERKIVSGIRFIKAIKITFSEK